MLRTIFFSDLDSPFGLPHLFELLSTPGCDVVAVVVGPGPSETNGRMRVVDRWGQAVTRDLVEATAGRSVPVLRPAALADSEFLARLLGLSADVIVSAGFSRILPSDVLRTPALAAVNLHPSRLPRVRGRNPWFWTVASGEAEAAVTAHHMTGAVDAGDIVFQVPVPIDSRETASSLRHKTTVESLRLVSRLVDAASRGHLARVPQDLATGSIFGEPTDDDRTIDWSAPSEAVDRLIRACLSSPGAVTRFRGHAVHVLEADLGTDGTLVGIDATPGTILKVTAHGVVVKAGAGHIVLRRLGVDGQTMAAAAAAGLVDGAGTSERFLSG